MPTSAVRLSGSYGWLGVEAFFVISGFVIPLSLWRAGYRPSQFPRYLARRLLRFEPAYLVSVAVAIALWEVGSLTPWFAGHPPDISAAQVAWHLFYLIPLSDYAWLNPVYWSLSYEFGFYIACGVLAPALMRTHASVTLLVFVLAWLIARDSYSPLFLVGFAALRLHLALGNALWNFTVGLLAVAAECWLLGPVVAIASGLSAALILLLATRRFPAALLFFGSISYSLYLMHVPIGGRVVNLAMRLHGGETANLVISLSALAVSVTVAWLLYRIVEQPSLAASKYLALLTSERSVLNRAARRTSYRMSLRRDVKERQMF
jgi:peptidoglycan/LPS O-acetylase OafA/YrhL